MKGAECCMSVFDVLRRKRPAAPFCTAVVPAAGSSTRMEGQDKMLLELGGVRCFSALWRPWRHVN